MSNAAVVIRAHLNFADAVTAHESTSKPTEIAD